jgi:hypothetical protein
VGIPLHLSARRPCTKTVGRRVMCERHLHSMMNRFHSSSTIVERQGLSPTSSDLPLETPDHGLSDRTKNIDTWRRDRLRRISAHASFREGSLRRPREVQGSVPAGRQLPPFNASLPHRPRSRASCLRRRRFGMRQSSRRRSKVITFIGCSRAVQWHFTGTEQWQRQWRTGRALRGRSGTTSSTAVAPWYARACTVLREHERFHNSPDANPSRAKGKSRERGRDFIQHLDHKPHRPAEDFVPSFVTRTSRKDAYHGVAWYSMWIAGCTSRQDA